MGMIAMLTCSAFAIDIGQRNQQLAQAQHAIDAAVITAAQHLGSPGNLSDYPGAVARAKEVIRENLGVPLTAWPPCSDTNHLPTVVAGDSDCISFKRTEAVDSPTGSVTHNIRVKLPTMTMDTILGGVTGTNKIDIAAVAASNSNNCILGSPGCDAATTSIAPTTTTIPAPTTTQSLYDQCVNAGIVSTLLSDSWYLTCVSVLPSFDRAGYQEDLCTALDSPVTLPVFGTSTWFTWTLSAHDAYLYYWSMCTPFVPNGQRDAWLGTKCAVPWTVYNDWALYVACLVRDPSITTWENWWNAYNATTTTTTAAPTTTAPPTTAPATTTTAPPPTTPGSIDISG